MYSQEISGPKAVLCLEFDTEKEASDFVNKFYSPLGGIAITSTLDDQTYYFKPIDADDVRNRYT